MSNCHRVVRQLTDYLDGALTKTEKQNIEQHLQVCSDCHEKYKRVKYLTQTLPHLPKYKTSPYFETVLRSRIRSEVLNDNLISKFTRNRWFVQVPAYASLAVTFIIIGFLLGRSIANKNVSPNDYAAASNSVQVTQYPTQPKAQDSRQAQPTRMKNYVLEVVHPEEIARDVKSAELSSAGLRSADSSKSNEVLSSSYSRPPVAGIFRQANATINF